MSIKPSSKITIAVISTILLLGVLLAVTNTPMAQTSPQIPVYKVVGSADLSSPGSASYWSKIPWINISLTANIPQAPTSGLTHYILVKAAWNGSWIFVLVRWYAPNPAFGAWSAAAGALYPPASGPGLFRQIILTPGTTYTIEKNYTNYVSIVNGKTIQGRLVFNYSGIGYMGSMGGMMGGMYMGGMRILLPAPNNTKITVLPNGTILYHGSPRPMEDLLYSDGMFYGYYTNSTWYYPDRVAIMWYMGSIGGMMGGMYMGGMMGGMRMDGMNLGGKYPGQTFDGVTFKDAGGSLTLPGGAANIWMWVSGATWNNSTYDPAFKANLWQNESLTGLPYVDPGNHGFAVPLYSNNTNMYEVDTAGIWYTPVASSGLNGSLFFIWTGATYQNGYWTVEYARPLAVPPNYAKWMPNITVGNTYYVAFAVWQGKLGETLFDKSITSSFLTLELVTTPPTTSVSTLTSPSGVPPITVDVIIAGVIIVILALVVVLYVVYRR